MKDKKKIIVPLLLAGVTATGVVSNISQVQQTQVQAESTTTINNVVGAEIKTSRFRALKDGSLVYQDTFNVGDNVYLPVVNVEDGVTLEYKIKKDSKEFEPTKDTDRNAYYFKAEYQGYYDVTIYAKKDGYVTTTLANLSVFVEREDATIKLPTNSEYVIPAKVAKNQTNLKIPAPSVIYGDNEEAEEVKDLQKGTMNVYLVAPTAENSITPLTLDTATQEFYAIDSDKLATVGTYQVVYEYKNEGGSVISRLESSFQVVDKYDTSEIKLKMIYKSSLAEKGVVNKDISIPRVDVVDENVSSSDAINAYVKVTVKNMKTGTVYDVDYDNYTFHPTEEGTYSVKYQAFIGVFGTDCKTVEESPGSPIVISDTEAPDVFPTYAYEFDDNGEITKVNNKTITATEGKTQREVAEEELVNRRVDVPSAVVVGQEFTIPAAYAIDNFNTYSNKNEDIIITRTYKPKSGSLTTVSTPANEVATIKFETSGSAQVRYYAKDKKGNETGEISYDIMVYDSIEDLKDGETTVKLDVGTTLITDKEETLTFAKPTATDTYDKHVDVKTYLIKGAYSETATKELLTETDDNGKYVIDVDSLVRDGLSEFTVVAEATIDKTLEGTRTGGLTTTKYQTVKIQRTSADAIAPSFEVVGGWNEQLYALNTVTDEEEGLKNIIADSNGAQIDDAGYLKTSAGAFIPVKVDSDINKAPFDQGSNILRIPTVKFTDAEDANLSISVEIRDRNGNIVDKYNQESIVKTTGSTNTYEVSGASFKLNSYGMYTVTFKAQDYAGNIVIRTYGIRVNDKTSPTITIIDEDKFNKEIEVGEYFEVPTATLMKEGEDVNGSTRWEVYNVSVTSSTSDFSKTSYTRYANGFIPNVEGTFFIRYYGEDDLGNETLLEDSMFTVTAKDTIAPTITLDLTERFTYNVVWNPAENTDYMDINIPVAFATDKNRGQVEVTYTVTGPNNIKPTVEAHSEHDYLKTFRAESEGKYTVVYSAIDSAGNESKIEKEICVGDCVAPTITWVDKDKDLPTEIKLNETYTLNVNEFLKLEDNDSRNTEATLRENLTITLTSPNGTSVTNKMGNDAGYKWEFTETGDYTLKITVKDKVGNSVTRDYTIRVPAEDTESNKVSPVLGTVLIVLSVVVLGGVVVYFVASSKKKTTKKSTSKKK